MEPVLENISIVVPDAGYLTGVREALRPPRRAAGVRRGEDRPDRRVRRARRSASASPLTSSCLAKSVGGGLPLAVFGGRAEVMATVSDNRMPHFGTYNGNPLVMAAAAAVDEVCTHEALAAAEKLNDRRARRHRRA